MDNLEKAILLRQMAQPKKRPLTDCERQARRRAKVKAESKSGEMSVSALAFDEALFDAMAKILTEGDHYGHVHAITLFAASAFRCPEQARRLIVRRLKARKLKVLKDPMTPFSS